MLYFVQMTILSNVKTDFCGGVCINYRFGFDVVGYGRGTSDGYGFMTKKAVAIMELMVAEQALLKDLEKKKTVKLLFAVGKELVFSGALVIMMVMVMVAKSCNFVGGDMKKNDTYIGKHPYQSWFSKHFATWANNHRGWPKMKKANRKIAKRKIREEDRKEFREYMR